MALQIESRVRARNCAQCAERPAVFHCCGKSKPACPAPPRPNPGRGAPPRPAAPRLTPPRPAPRPALPRPAPLAGSAVARQAALCPQPARAFALILRPARAPWPVVAVPGVAERAGSADCWRGSVRQRWASSPACVGKQHTCTRSRHQPGPIPGVGGGSRPPRAGPVPPPPPSGIARPWSAWAPPRSGT